MTRFYNNRYAVLLAFAALSLVVFALLRIWLISISWGELGQETPLEIASVFLVGFAYDCAFTLYLCAPVVILLTLLSARFDDSRIFEALLALVYLVLLFTLFFTVAAELAFWDEFTVRFNFISVDYLVYSHEVTQNIFEYLPVKQILLLILLVVAVLMFFTGPVLVGAAKNSLTLLQRLGISSVWLVGAVLFGVLLDQSLRNQYDNNFLREIASNGPYQFFASFRNNELDYDTFYATGDDTQLSDFVRTDLKVAKSSFASKTLFDIKRTVDNPGQEKKLNVVFISVESLSGEFLQRYGHELPWTPFIDGLMEQSLVFDRLYATGTRTTRGLEALTLSIPPTPGRSIVKRPDNSKMFSLGKVFKDKNYDVAYLYGGRGYFDNMNEFFTGNGYRVVDQNDYTADEVEFSNAWGVDDLSLFRKTLKQADADYAKNQPFFFHVMTVSNHAPFTYPAGRVEVEPGIGRGGGVQYTDYALSKFIEAARQKPWFDDTVFVMVADHTANSAGRTGLTLSRYHIPCLVYAPKHIKPQSVDRLASQIDVAPTLLALLNFDYTSSFYGQNILSDNFQERAFIGNYQKLGLYESGELVILSPQKVVQRINSPDVYRDPENPGELESIESIRADQSATAEKTLAYYQTADRMLKNRLNRW